MVYIIHGTYWAFVFQLWFVLTMCMFTYFWLLLTFYAHDKFSISCRDPQRRYGWCLHPSWHCPGPAVGIGSLAHQGPPSSSGPRLRPPVARTGLLPIRYLATIQGCRSNTCCPAAFLHNKRNTYIETTNLSL